MKYETVLRSGLILALATAGTLTEATARAQDKQACVSAYEEGQQLRKDGKLIESRARLLVCAQSACPAVIRKDCTVWVSEVEQVTPTVVLAARGPKGQDAVDVTVTLDGKPLTKRLDGKALTLDPGPHTFRFEIAGAPPRDETILVHEGERNRQILADFQPPASRAAAPATAAAAPAGPPPMKPAPMPVGAYVLGGVGVAGLGVFTAFGLMGMADKKDLDAKSCKPDCAQSDVDKAKQKFLIADIGLGVGVVSLAAAAVLYFTKGEVPAGESTMSVGVAPVKGGAAVGVGGTF
jgi:hypothetical protein